MWLRANKIVFTKSDGHRTILNTDTLESPWGLLLFDGINEPRQASIVDVENDYEEYFRKE